MHLAALTHVHMTLHMCTVHRSAQRTCTCTCKYICTHIQYHTYCTCTCTHVHVCTHMYLHVRTCTAHMHPVFMHKIAHTYVLIRHHMYVHMHYLIIYKCMQHNHNTTNICNVRMNAYDPQKHYFSFDVYCIMRQSNKNVNKQD